MSGLYWRAMVCFICERPATTTCDECGRGVCNSHIASRFTSLNTCEQCSRRQEEKSRQEDEKRRRLQCSFCSSEGEYVCRICSKRACYKHGQRIQVFHTRARTAYVWERCKDHSKKNKAGLVALGYHPFYDPSLISGILDWLNGEKENAHVTIGDQDEVRPMTSDE
jgi:hypothetical protein